MGIDESNKVVEPEQQEQIQNKAEPTEETENKEETQIPVEGQGEEDVEDVVVSFGDEETPPQDNEHSEAETARFRELRQSHKDKSKENKRLLKELEELKGSKNKEEILTLGEKPTLEGSDYDEDDYLEKVDSYYERKKKIAKQEEENQKQIKSQEEESLKVFDNYKQKKESLKVKDYQIAEDNVIESLSKDHQNIILLTAIDPAKLVYALGNNDAKLKELSTIKDPIKFAATVARMETTLKVSNRKKAPAPEKKIMGGGGIGTSDAQLEKLKAKAYDSGNFSEYTAYKKQLKRNK